MSDQRIELIPPIPPPPHLRKKPAFDLSNPSLALIFYNFVLGIPLSYFITFTNKKLLEYLGFEEMLRGGSGILGSKILFVVVNVIIILAWAKEIGEEERREYERVMEEEIAWWDGEIERLEGMVVLARQLQQYSTPDRRLNKNPPLSIIDPNEHFSERGSTVNALNGIQEWDFVVGAKSPKGKSLGDGGSMLKGLMVSKLPKMKKKVKEVGKEE